jgi:hypothetical protein
MFLFSLFGTVLRILLRHSYASIALFLCSEQTIVRSSLQQDCSGKNLLLCPVSALTLGIQVVGFVRDMLAIVVICCFFFLIRIACSQS